MSADTLYQELNSLDTKEKKRFFHLLRESDFAEMDPEGFMQYWDRVVSKTTKWHTEADLLAIMESSKDEEEDDDSV